MPAREFIEWEAYIARHPSTVWVLDYQMAHLLSMFYSAHKGKDSPPLQQSDWSILERLRPKTVEELRKAESDRVRRIFGIGG